MVEMTEMGFRRIHILLFSVLGLTFAALPLAAQQPPVEARIAGLEGNEEYMSLLREDAVLQSRVDSVVRAVEQVRLRLREYPDERQACSEEILRLESRIFDLRNAKGRLIDRINTIEQEWVLANLDNPDAASSERPAARVPDSLKVRNLVYNPCFGEQLPKADYAALLRAQELELRAVDLVNRYFANYETAAQLAEAYAAAATESEAGEIYDRYGAMQRIDRALSDSLAGVWNYIFDNKNYAYGYLLDKLGQEEALTREEEALAKAQRQVASLRGETASDAVADYFLRKQVLVDYEASVAGLLDLGAARDSLRGVAAQLREADFRRPRVEVAQRYFLDFDSVVFTKTPKYSYSNPIPECRVYEHGTIYRLLLGTFNTKRAVSTFRGAYPLSYLVNDEGKWCYFTGGFATREEADSVQTVLKKHGFVRPEVVVWTDGVYRNLSREPEAGAVAYRIEIDGADALSEEVRQTIASLSEGRELSRVGSGTFVVGTFDDRAVADRLAEALRQADAALEIKVAEIVPQTE